MPQSQGIHEQRLTAAAALRARAEHAEWTEMLAYADRLITEYSQTTEYFRRQAQLKSIALEIAVAMHLSEGQVHRRLSCARASRQQAPTVWAAFAAGVVDGQRAAMISDAVDKLVRPESVATLDTKVIDYAQTHTSVELRGWLKRFIVRVEADLFNERAEAERADRNVDVVHGDDGMAWLNAYLPSHVAAAIMNRLTREAKTLTHDPRTIAQRRADLLAAWLTTNETGEAATGADIAVIIPLGTLLGLSDAPAVSADGAWIVPAKWITNTANNPFWHKLLVDTGGNVLEHHYTGRFAPTVLEKALIFRDGTCQAPTCTKPAAHCENDHRQPRPHGPTHGANMWPQRPLAPSALQPTSPDEIPQHHHLDPALRPHHRRRTSPTRSLSSGVSGCGRRR